MYGLDLDSIRVECDFQGNKLTATVPYSLLSTLIEFWIVARRAQTATTEKTARPGQFKSSLAAAVPPVADGPTEEWKTKEAHDPVMVFLRHAAPHVKSQKKTDKREDKWAQLLDKLPEVLDSNGEDRWQPPQAMSSQAPPAPPAAPTVSSFEVQKGSQRYQARSYYPRAFVHPVPREVLLKIRQGISFLKAWREYRGLTMEEAAELLERKRSAIAYAENSYNKPTLSTLQRYADVYDCKLEQLIAKPGSDTSRWNPDVDPITPLSDEDVLQPPSPVPKSKPPSNSASNGASPSKKNKREVKATRKIATVLAQTK